MTHLICFSNTDRYICAVEFVAKSESTRQYIVESTSGIFNKQGYAGTALSDLIEATKLSKGSIYGNFENKEAVAIAAFDYNLSQVQQLIQAKVNQFDGYKEKLLAHAQVYHSFEQTPFPEGGCPLMNTGVEADDTSEVLREKAAAGIMSWMSSLATLIENGMATHVFRPDTNSNETATTIIALIEGGMMMSKVTHNNSLMDGIVSVIGELIERISNPNES